MNIFFNKFILEVSIFIIYFFSFIIFLSFIKLLRKGDDQNRTLQKIIGGLGVFIVAFIANEFYVYLLSIFIGGLIIASEDFMKFLAAVLRTRGDKIAETVNAFRTSFATARDIEEKTQAEIVEAPNDEINFTNEQQRTASESEMEDKAKIVQRAEKIRKIEEKINNKFTQTYGNNYLTEVKLYNEYNSLVVDGIVKSGQKFLKIIEIKYIGSKSFPILHHIVGRFIKKIKRLNVNLPVVFVFVSEEMTVATASGIYNNIKIVNNYEVELSFYKIVDNEPTIIDVNPELIKSTSLTTVEYEAD